jgi:hypothetical protein
MNRRTHSVAALALSVLMTLAIFSGVISLSSVEHGGAAVYAQAASASQG